MAELYESVPTRTLQAWRALLQWATFVFQIVLQTLRGTQIASSLLAFRNQNRLLFPSGEGLGLGSDSPLEFAPVPIEIPVDAGDESVERMTVVLDLDETLVCAYETSSLTAIIRSQAIEAGLRFFELECISTEREADGKQKVNHVTVFERPGLHEFLQEISEFADLVLFTAGLEGYARPLVDKIDAGNKFSLRLYRPSTTTTEYRDHVKDLSCLSKSFCRMVIVDNNPFSFLLQPLNGIPCVPFYAGQPYDEQLMKVILPLLKHLSVQKDVRPVLHEKFHMPEWFHKQGIPMCDWIACDSPCGGT